MERDVNEIQKELVEAEGELAFYIAEYNGHSSFTQGQYLPHIEKWKARVKTLREIKDAHE